MAGGRHDHLICALTAADIMHLRNALKARVWEKCSKRIATNANITADMGMSELLKLLREQRWEYVPNDRGECCGAMFPSEALRIGNRSLAQTDTEEHD